MTKPREKTCEELTGWDFRQIDGSFQFPLISLLSLKREAPASFLKPRKRQGLCSISIFASIFCRFGRPSVHAELDDRHHRAGGHHLGGLGHIGGGRGSLHHIGRGGGLRGSRGFRRFGAFRGAGSFRGGVFFRIGPVQPAVGRAAVARIFVQPAIDLFRHLFRGPVASNRPVPPFVPRSSPSGRGRSG